MSHERGKRFHQKNERTTSLPPATPCAPFLLTQLGGESLRRGVAGISFTDAPLCKRMGKAAWRRHRGGVRVTEL